jgi:hypothetical protein
MKKLLRSVAAHGALLVVAVPLTVLTVLPGTQQALAQEAATDTVAIPSAKQLEEQQAEAEARQQAPQQTKAGSFPKGSKRGGFVLGWGRAFNNDYLLLGVGLGYYVLDGLELGASFQGWLGSTPSIYQLAPEIRYVIWQLGNIKPYAGVFYRWNFIEQLEDLNSYGGRAGIFYRSSRKSYVGLGAVWENFTDCNTAIYGDCSTVYPEAVFAVRF